MSLPYDVYHSVMLCPDARNMWNTLCVLYEGTDEVKENKKVNLNRQYELFFSKKGESLTETFNRFNYLLNDLKSVGIEKENTALLNKFMDSLPKQWETLITCLKTSGFLKTMTLTALWYFPK